MLHVTELTVSVLQDRLTEDARRLCRQLRRMIDQTAPTCDLSRQRREYLLSLESLAEIRRDRRRFGAIGLDFEFSRQQRKVHRLFHPRHARGKGIEMMEISKEKIGIGDLVPLQNSGIGPSVRGIGRAVQLQLF